MSDTIIIRPMVGHDYLTVSESAGSTNYEISSPMTASSEAIYVSASDAHVADLVADSYAADPWTPVLADRVNKWVLSENQ